MAEIDCFLWKGTRPSRPQLSREPKKAFIKLPLDGKEANSIG
jgi:hypothetical protein